ncbi:hypothetical protein PoB_002369500 [Plakobranchus ocellatus]|uniref:Uncharacterized protein n=1 Tax=Plakobranchus ocellatus TaxID=259542 RepID=A0AAV3ZNB7_9GAST|nr:hypothetical protein PoB_002369500 [Plakobranchus ocellatus]
MQSADDIFKRSCRLTNPSPSNKPSLQIPVHAIMLHNLFVICVCVCRVVMEEPGTRAALHRAANFPALCPLAEALLLPVVYSRPGAIFTTARQMSFTCSTIDCSLVVPLDGSRSLLMAAL